MAQIAKIISAAVIVFWISVLSAQYGLYKPQGVIGCFIQMICFVLCGISAGVSVKELIGGQKGKFKYIINIVANVLFMAAMLVYELCVFWGV